MDSESNGLIGKLIQRLKLVSLTRNQWSSLGILVFLLLALPAAVALTQVSQETRRRAMEPPPISPL